MPVDTIDVRTAIDVYQNATGRVDSLWGLYGAIALAVIGYAWGNNARLGGRGKLFLGFAWLVFAVSNWLAIDRAQSLAKHATKTIAYMTGATLNACLRAPDSSSVAMLCRMHASDPIDVTAFQWIVTVGVVGAIYLAHRRDRFVQGNSPIAS